MKRISSRTVVKFFVFCAWFVLMYALYFWMRHHGIQLRHLPRTLSFLIRSFGLWGPIVLIALHVLRTFIVFVPATVLTLVAGTVYGPWAGILLNIIGDNLSANIGFWMGRLLGRRFMKDHEHGWMKKYDSALREEGFFTILFMRLIGFPFDVMNYGVGMTSVPYKQYVFGTFLGMIPAIVTITVLGDAFSNPRGLLAFVILLVLTILLVFGIRRSAWVRTHILKNTSLETNE